MHRGGGKTAAELALVWGHQDIAVVIQDHNAEAASGGVDWSRAVIRKLSEDHPYLTLEQVLEQHQQGMDG